MTKTHKKVLFVCTQDWFYHSHFGQLCKYAQCLGISDISIACGVELNSKLASEHGEKFVRLAPASFRANKIVIENFD